MPSRETRYEADPITRLFRSCAPDEPVPPDDPRYVNCDDVRGENLAMLYARALRRADPTHPEVKVFAGHRGVGKTSELLRLKRYLENPGEGQRPFLVVLSDAGRALDLNDLDFPDLLVFQAAEIQRQLRAAEIPGFEASENEAACRRLCEMTGGHPRHLMMFVRAAANEVDALPITRDAVDKAIRNYANSLHREVPDEFWPHLKKFDRPQNDIPKDEIHQEMLLLLHVFEYMNGEPWYEVNPVLRTLPQFDD